MPIHWIFQGKLPDNFHCILIFAVFYVNSGHYFSQNFIIFVILCVIALDRLLLFLFIFFFIFENNSSVFILQEVLNNTSAIKRQFFLTVLALETFLLQEVTDVVLCRIDGMAGRRDGTLCLEEVVDEAHGSGLCCICCLLIAFVFLCLRVVRLFCQSEDGFTAWHEDGSPAQSLVIGSVMFLVKRLQKQDTSSVKVRMLLRERLQLGNRVIIYGVGPSDIIYIWCRAFGYNL